MNPNSKIERAETHETDGQVRVPKADRALRSRDCINNVRREMAKPITQVQFGVRVELTSLTTTPFPGFVTEVLLAVK